MNLPEQWRCERDHLVRRQRSAEERGERGPFSWRVRLLRLGGTVGFFSPGATKRGEHGIGGNEVTERSGSGGNHGFIGLVENHHWVRAT